MKDALDRQRVGGHELPKKNLRRNWYLADTVRRNPSRKEVGRLI